LTARALQIVDVNWIVDDAPAPVVGLLDHSFQRPFNHRLPRMPVSLD
jgi:hypothetical protein